VSESAQTMGMGRHGFEKEKPRVGRRGGPLVLDEFVAQRHTSAE
jgi:hypothetical protein